MAYTSGSLLGNYAPQMQEPYQIESTLAQGAETGNPVAIGLLGQYNYERQLREGEYADRLANQMQFGQQQLHQQLTDQNMRAITEGAKTPGVLSMFASSPQYSGMFAGMDPAAIQQASDLATQQAQSGIFKNTGQGYQGFAVGGLNIPPAAVQGVVPGATQGTPVAVQAAQINAASRVAAANARAAGGGGGGSASLTSPPDPAMAGAQIHRNLPKGSANWTDQQIRDFYASHGGAGPAQVPNPNTTGAINQQPLPITTGRQGITNLPMAKTDTPANNQTVQRPPAPGTAIDKNDPALRNTVGAINNKIATLPPAQQKNFSNYSLKMGSDGAIHVFDSAGADRGPVGQAKGGK